METINEFNCIHFAYDLEFQKCVKFGKQFFKNLDKQNLIVYMDNFGWFHLEKSIIIAQLIYFIMKSMIKNKTKFIALKILVQKGENSDNWIFKSIQLTLTELSKRKIFNFNFKELSDSLSNTLNIQISPNEKLQLELIICDYSCNLPSKISTPFETILLNDSNDLDSITDTLINETSKNLFIYNLIPASLLSHNNIDKCIMYVCNIGIIFRLTNFLIPQSILNVIQKF